MRILYKSKLSIYFLVLMFLSLILNDISIFDLNSFFRYFKIAVLIVGVIIFSNSRLFGLFYFKFKSLIIFWFISILFCLLYVFEGYNNFEFIYANVSFILYIYVYFLLINEMFSRPQPYVVKMYQIFTIFNKILLFVFFSFTFLTIITGHSVWDTLDPTRVGLRLFFNSYIAFGIFSVVGFIINFILIKLRGFDYKYLIGLIFYAVLTYLSNSRNAQLICLIILVLSYIKPIYSVLLKFRYPLIFTILVLLAYNFYSIKSYLTSDLVVFFTSGRSNIWNYLFEDLIKHNFLFGKGIFGRNHLILENNIDHNYYLQRVDFLYFHNSYLEILSAAGLIGLVFFMFFVKENIDKGLKFMRPIVLSIFIGSFFEGFLIQPMLLISMLFWMIIFINAVVKKMPINDLRANS